MSNLNNLLDKYKQSCLLTSDSALATSLGITRQSVHQWRNGVAWPRDDYVIRMAQGINEPAERWLAAIGMERAPDSAKPYWKRLLQAAAVIAGVYMLSHIGGQTGALAPLLLAACNSGTLYIM